MKVLKQFNELYDNVSQDIIDDIIETLENFGEQFDVLPISIKKALNAMASLGQVIDNDGRITRSMLDQVKKVLVEYEESLAQLEASNDDEDDLNYDEMLSQFDKQIQQLDIEDTNFSTQIKSKLARDVKRMKAKLLTDLPTDELFKIVQLDTIPIVHRRLNARKLQALGLTIREFNEYFIFENQRVLAINIEYLNEVNKGVAKKRQLDAYDLAEKILNENYNLMGIFGQDPIRIRGTSHLYFWLMPTSIMSEVVKLVGVMDEWGVNS